MILLKIMQPVALDECVIQSSDTTTLLPEYCNLLDVFHFSPSHAQMDRYSNKDGVHSLYGAAYGCLLELCKTLAFTKFKTSHHKRRC